MAPTAFETAYSAAPGGADAAAAFAWRIPDGRTPSPKASTKRAQPQGPAARPISILILCALAQRDGSRSRGTDADPGHQRRWHLQPRYRRPGRGRGALR